MSVAYQTSGSIAVSDEEALRFADFAASYCETLDSGQHFAEPAAARDRIRKKLMMKQPGEVKLSGKQILIIVCATWRIYFSSVQAIQGLG